MVAAGLRRIDSGQAGHQIAVRLVEGGIAAAAVEAEAGLRGRTGVLPEKEVWSVLDQSISKPKISRM
jgi:hypothetical protein